MPRFPVALGSFLTYLWWPGAWPGPQKAPLQPHREKVPKSDRPKKVLVTGFHFSWVRVREEAWSMELRSSRIKLKLHPPQSHTEPFRVLRLPTCEWE